MKLPILYKRTRTGAIQFWKIEVEVQANGIPLTVKCSNTLLDPPKDKSPNAGSALDEECLEQAIYAAESDWKRKKRQGYKTLEELGVSQVWKVNDIEYQTFEEALNATLPL